MNDLSNEEIAARVEALRLARMEKGRVLTEAEFEAVVGPPIYRRRSRAGGGMPDSPWTPSCMERVLAVAATLCDSRDRVRFSDIARAVGRSERTVGVAVKVLREQGRWPYRNFRDGYTVADRKQAV